MRVTNTTNQDYWFGPLHLAAGNGSYIDVDDTSSTSLYLSDDSVADAINTLAASLKVNVTNLSTGVLFPRPTGTPEVLHGDGSPEGIVYAGQGSLYLRRDSGSLYTKKTGIHLNTGWNSIAQGSITTTGPFSVGPPSTPNDGDIWIATGIGASGLRWQFQYDATESTAYKWKFVGGAAVTVGDVTGNQRQNTVDNAWEFISGMPSFTISRGGKYSGVFGGMWNGNNGNTTYLTVVGTTSGVSGLHDGSAAFIDLGNSFGNNETLPIGGSFDDILSNIARTAGETLELQMQSTAHTNVALSDTWLKLWPSMII